MNNVSVQISKYRIFKRQAPLLNMLILIIKNKTKPVKQLTSNSGLFDPDWLVNFNRTFRDSCFCSQLSTGVLTKFSRLTFTVGNVM